jgi:hypothetical protein
MTISNPIFEQSEPDPLPPECRNAAERVLRVFLEHAVRFGWDTSAAAMALADAADDFVLLQSRNLTEKH